jgi:hypothetical protein
MASMVHILFIEGEWRESKVRWIETYKQNFSTIVRGDLLSKTEINATFISSRNFRGYIKLKRGGGFF